MQKIVLITLLLNWTISAAQKPNILFMMADDQGWNGLSVQMHPSIPDSKHPYIQTPVLASLAQEGMRFSAAYAPSPVCSSTRISLQTGKSPAALNWTKAARSMTSQSNYPLIPPVNIRNIPNSEITIGEILQSAGYLTAHYGKWHINGDGPEANGYDDHDGDIGNEYAENYNDPNPADIFGMAERAAAFMAKAKKNKKPFFIQMSFHALHAPQNAIKTTVSKYQKLNPNGKEKEIGRAAISENLDTGVGVVLKALKKLGLEKNTYVIYMSDNGSGGKKGPLRGGKGDAWEGGIRSPMIVRGPGIKANSWCHERVVGYDWYPTYCYWAGVKELPKGLEGGALNQLLMNDGKGRVKRNRQEMVFHFPHYQGDTPHTALFLDDYKLMKFYENGKLMLFNIKEDISESQDLSAKYPEKTQQLYATMQRYLVDIKAKIPIKNDAYDPTKPSIPDKKGGGKKDKKGKKGKRK